MCKLSDLRVATACAVVLGALIGPVSADYPEKAIRLTVSSAAGGGTDTVARRIAAKLSERWGQPVVVENKAGGAGGVAAQAVARSEPNGYALLLAAGTNMTVGPVLYKWSQNIGVDPIKDFVPITQLASAPYLVLVHPSTPAKTLTQLIALIKGKKDFSFASSYVSSPDHLAGVLFKQMAGLPNLVHIPYKGGGPAAAAVRTGQVPMGFTTIPAAMPFLQNQAIHALAITGSKRSKEFPDIPTVGEVLPGYEMLTWYGMWAPAGTAKAVINKVYTEVKQIIALPEINVVLRRDGFDPVGSAPDDFAAFVKKEAAKYSELITRNNVRIEN